MPEDEESRVALLRVMPKEIASREPILPSALKDSFRLLIAERKQAQKLQSLGLNPTRSAIFVGPPGVGKTLTAGWLAMQLDLPLYILDLTAVMSSLLGRSGTNIRAAIDFAKARPCVLLIDEIDAIAKRRSDDSDIGELKRLVTVLMQEVDAWPAGGLLLAATNHPELMDSALWRRFDMVAEFPRPSRAAISEAARQFFAGDVSLFEPWLIPITFAFEGESLSDIERTIHRFRRGLALSTGSPAELASEYVRSKARGLSKQARIDLAVHMFAGGLLSQHAASELTGVSRDTIRKYSSDKTLPRTEG